MASTTGQKDNSTKGLKISLRRSALALLEKRYGIKEPVVMETHGGNGVLYRYCYSDYDYGIVIEKDAAKAAVLALQRPGWAVFEADSAHAVKEGLGSHVPIDFVDFDPYGEPWPTIDAFLQSERPWPEVLTFCVNDGLRQALLVKGGWNIASMEDIVQVVGSSNIAGQYLDVCKVLIAQKAAQRGYKLKHWTAYYCGKGDHMTHYAAVMVMT